MDFRILLMELGACPEAIKWVGNKTEQEAWDTCHRGDWIIWLLRHRGKNLDSKKIIETCLDYMFQEQRLTFSKKLMSLPTLLDAEQACYYAYFHRGFDSSQLVRELAQCGKQLEFCF
jgi:hypothetical protein